MIWFFQRHRDRLHYEIRHQTDGFDYELVITHSDGRQDVERFADPGALLQRSSGLNHSLMAAGWHPPSLPAQLRRDKPAFAARSSQGRQAR
jgi:hypothetical protein